MKLAEMESTIMNIKKSNVRLEKDIEMIDDVMEKGFDFTTVKG
jgi:hypothetical protein